MEPNQINEQLNILDKFIQWTEKYSIKKILKAITICWFTVFTLQITFNPSSVYERYLKYAELVHQKKIEKRIEISPKIQVECERILLRTKANRCMLIECHNSNTNSLGCPFFYGDCTFEAVRDVKFISEYYKDFSISKYPILAYVYQNGYFFGNIEDLAKIDNRLSAELPLNNSEYIILKALPNNCGFLVITYADEKNVNLKKDKREIEFCYNKIIRLFTE